MAKATYSYATHYIESIGVWFTYQRLLWATNLHSNGLSSRYIDTEPLPDLSYDVKYKKSPANAKGTRNSDACL